MDVTIEERGPVHLVALGWTGAYSDAPEIPALWRRLADLQPELPPPARAGTVLGASHSRRSDFTYYVGFEVRAAAGGIELPEGVRRLALPAERYARCEHRGPMATVQDSYRALFAALAARKLARDEGALWLEEFDGRYLPFRDAADRSVNAYGIWMPVRSVG